MKYKLIFSTKQECVFAGVVWTFLLSSILSPLSPSLWETARYRLKYCLKGPLNPKQPTNQWIIPQIISFIQTETNGFWRNSKTKRTERQLKNFVVFIQESFRGFFCFFSHYMLACKDGSSSSFLGLKAYFYFA